MKIIDAKAESSISYGGLIEKIEILRSTLRWASKLDRPQIQKLLKQCNSLRDEVMQLSHKERFVKASSGSGSRRKQTTAQRRKALLDRSFVFEGVFGESQKLLDALEIAEKAAPTDLPVLIDGESGTGKELMAKVIHANGSRADKPYISVNCGAIPDNLLESELFGHKRGAFTGAASDRSGKFETAHTGTIFLDEIGELPLPGQVKLLRVLQSAEIQRVGSDKVIEVDTRIVAATNKNLLEMCERGSFREDLYYRLSVIQVTLPPLRERKDEIPLLIEYFLVESCNRNDQPDEQGCHHQRACDDERAIAPDVLPQPVHRAGRTRLHGLVVQESLDVVGQAVGRLVTPVAFLVQRLHHNPVQIAAEKLS